MKEEYIRIWDLRRSREWWGIEGGVGRGVGLKEEFGMMWD